LDRLDVCSGGPLTGSIGTLYYNRPHPKKDSIQLCVSSITITNTNYIVSRSQGSKVANRKTKQIMELVSVESVGESKVRKSAESNFKDFEDGVQNFCAIESGHKIIVTRNTKDFKESDLSILTPKELLSKINSSHYQGV